jgi:glucose/arabinose dehydrogenase
LQEIWGLFIALVLCVQLLYCKAMFTKTRTFTRCLAIVLGFIAATPLAAQQFREIEQGYPGIRVEEVVNGLGIPWGMAFISPHQILITERAGRVLLLDINKFAFVDLRNAPEVVAEGQGGMLDVAVGPNFESEGWIYFTYSKRSSGEAATTLARARLGQNQLVDWQDLLVTDTATDKRQHFGSRIAFDANGHVFFGVGDRGKRSMAQDLSNHIGTIMRLNLDGSVPSDNPYFGIPGTRSEVWSFGHRNPQGLAFDVPTSRLWEIEHGPRGGDEINLITKARNYGWPVISHGKEYWGPIAVGEGTSKQGMEQPRKVYIPSIAPGSLIMYQGDAFPEWRGNLFAGALKLRHLNRIELSEPGQVINEERILEDLNERIRALAISPEGLIYFSTDSGRILRILPE